MTRAQYAQVMNNNTSRTAATTQLVAMVSWNDAVVFCSKLSEQKGMKYRLPTEAEWEYACHAGTTTIFSFGDDVRELPQYAWYNKNSTGSTHPVGKLKPNPWGLFDMHGNVWEWCQDWYAAYGSAAIQRGVRCVAGRGILHWTGVPPCCRPPQRPTSRVSQCWFSPGQSMPSASLTTSPGNAARESS